MSKYSQEKVDPFLLFESYVSIPEDLFEERLRILKSIYKVLTDDGSTLSAYEMLSKELPKYFDCRLEEVGDLCNNMIKLCSSIGEFAQAISFGNRAIEIYKELGLEDSWQHVYNNISGVFFKMGEFEKALEYVERALDFSVKSGDEVRTAFQLNNKAIILENIYKDGSGIPFLEESILLKQKNNLTRELSRSYLNLADIYSYTGSIHQTLPLLEKARSIAEDLGDSWAVTDSYRYEGDYWLKMGDCDKALKAFEKAIDFHKKNNSKREIVGILEGMSKTCELLGDKDRAIELLREVIDLNSALFKEEKARSIAQLEYALSAKQKLIELERLSEQNHKLSEANRTIMEKNIELRRVHEELKRLNDDLRIQAESDPLTGFLNQQNMHLIIEKEIERARETGSPLTMIMFDFDDFKRINDTYGHLKGDEVLREVSSIVKATLRNTDYAFRYGGEEFLILLPLTGLQNALLVAKRVREDIESFAFPITISVGVSVWEGESETKFIQKTDRYLYKAKEDGKNCIRSQGL